MSLTEINPGVRISEKAWWNSETQEIFCPEVIKLLTHLHRKFNPKRIELLKNRDEQKALWNQGQLPNYLPKDSVAASGDWKVCNIPEDYRVRRVEITGPVNDTKMVINMLSRNADGHRADTAMVDFEDSMKPSFPNVINGFKNVIGAASGHLRYVKPAKGNSPEKKYELDPKDMAGLMVRVRGLHLEETNLEIDGTAIHGGMLDLAVCFFHTAKTLVEQGKTPKYYIPKCEHYLEARWWNELFSELETSLGFNIPTLRATFLIETLPAAFQVEEILYEAREHIIGLNVGRWDKIFSDIKVLGQHKDRISADRATINMNKFWMDNYAKRLIKICHTRGAYAIGGMSSFTPGKEESVRKAQTDKVIADKTNEFSIGHDGCWVSHPYFIGHAMSAFTRDNQLDRKLEYMDKYPDLVMDGKGPQTLEGLRTNIRVGIAYMQGWNDDLGCVSWDNLMEDLATLEISRAQTWQWLHHEITLESGETVTRELIQNIFDEELVKIKSELVANNVTEAIITKFEKARTDAEELFLREELADFITTKSDLFA